MKSDHLQTPSNEISKWRPILLSFMSVILAGGAIWYAWLRYNSLLNQSNTSGYQWIQPALIGLMGILCLWATVLFILRKPSAWPLFQTGLSIVPVVLFINLIILVFRVIQNLIQGNTGFFLERFLSQPEKVLFISIVIIVLILLDALGKREKSRNNS